MKTLAVIPARYASIRFPGKPLVMIQGKTMIQRVYEKASAAKQVDEVIVATDDQRIFQEVLNFGGKVMMTSPDHQSGTDRCGEVAAQFPDFDVVINIQGDEPFIPEAMIDELVATFKQSSDTKIATLAKRIDHQASLHDPNTVKLVLDQQQNALYFSRQAIPYQRAHPKEEWLAHHEYYQHIGIYIFDQHTLLDIVQLKVGQLEEVEKLEQLRWLAQGYKIGVGITTYESVGIDTPEDLEHFLKK